MAKRTPEQARRYNHAMDVVCETLETNLEQHSGLITLDHLPGVLTPDGRDTTLTETAKRRGETVLSIHGRLFLIRHEPDIVEQIAQSLRTYATSLLNAADAIEREMSDWDAEQAREAHAASA